MARQFISFFDATDALLGSVIVSQATEFDAYTYAQGAGLYPVGTAVAIADRIADEYAVADDTPITAADAVISHDIHGSPRVTLTEPSPLALLDTAPSVTGGIASAVDNHPALTLALVGGYGLKINVGDPTYIDVLVAGIYTMTTSQDVTADTPGDLTYAMGELTSTVGTWPDYIAAPSISTHAPVISAVHWIPAGVQRIGPLTGYAETGGGTWTHTGSLLVQQIR